MNNYKTEQLAQDEKFEKDFPASDTHHFGWGIKEPVKIKEYIILRDTALLEAFKKDVGDAENIYQTLQELQKLISQTESYVIRDDLVRMYKDLLLKI